VNRGGESFPSEVVSALYEPKATKTVLVVNGFHRLSSPAIINDSQRQGFDLDEDAGVSYGLTGGWSGRQTSFDKSRMGSETSSGLGYSGNELVGKFIAGNTFDYIKEHTNAIATAHIYNVASCSSKAIETGIVNMNNYDAVDLILGLEKFSTTQTKYYRTFSPTMKQKISNYLARGGKMLASGAYIGADNDNQEDSQWLDQTLHADYSGALKTDTINSISGLGINGFDIYRTLNPDHYCVQHADKLSPATDAFCTMTYSDGSSAAVAFEGGKDRSHQAHRTFIMGFPLESIKDINTRDNIMRGILAFLLKD
jgi:hypothetical protein